MSSIILHVPQLSKCLSKGFERSVHWNQHKTKSEKKISQMNIDIFSNQILLDSVDHLFYFIQTKITISTDLKRKL